MKLPQRVASRAALLQANIAGDDSPIFQHHVHEVRAEMQVRELVQLHRRYGTHLVLTVFLAGAITGCSGRKDVSAPPRAPASAAPPAQAAEEARPVVSKNTNKLKTRLGCNKQVQMAKQPGGNKWPARWPPHGRCPQRPRAGRWRASVPCGRPLRWRAGLPGLPPASSS